MIRSTLPELDAQTTEQWLETCRQELAPVIDQAELVSFVIRHRKDLAAPPWSLQGVSLMRKYSGLMDLTIEHMFRMAMEQAEAAGELSSATGKPQVAVAATGGYGRRELSPYSDIDVVFIASDDEDLGKDAIVRRMFHLIMDVFLNGVKIKVGYAYRQPSQCLGLPHETQTALLDMRLLGGSETLFQRFRHSLRHSIDPLGFLRNNRLQREKSRDRYGQSPHRVEPNVKEGAGGLRDIHAARWAAQMTFNVPGQKAWSELCSRGALTQQDVRQMDDALGFISGVRHLLHISSGRDNDVLTVERQEAVAASTSWPEGAAPVDQLMAQYYAHAENVDYLSRKVLQYCEKQRFSIEPGVFSLDGQVHLTGAEDPAMPATDPVPAESSRPCESEFITRIIRYSQEYGIGLSQSAQDAIRECVAGHQGDGAGDKSAALLNILNGQQVSVTLTQTARLGALQWLLPEFGELMHLLPGDAAHQHTVGEHSLQVVRNLDEFRDDEDEEIRVIFSEVKDLRLLYLAGLLHDVGKVGSNGNHAEVGAVVARQIADRIGLPQEDASAISTLVRHHLLMGETARLRDMNDTRTVTEFVATIADSDLLRMLFLLTLADFRAVGDANWSAVHVRFLRELYHRTARQLSTPAIQDYEFDIERHRRRVRRELTLVNLPPAEVDEHCRCMPISYLLNTSPEDMASHIDHVRQVRTGTPVVELRDDRLSDFTKLTVCALDDPAPGLLAKIAGVLYAIDVDIHAAEVFTREADDRIAVDSLYLDFQGCQLPEFKKRQVAMDMSNVLTGETTVEQLLSVRNKSLNHPLDVHDLAVLSHLSDRHTVLDVSVADHEGLLYYLTKAISSLGWNIHSAHVTTFGGRARDAFYVTDTNGEKLKSGSGRKLRAALAAGGA